MSYNPHPSVIVDGTTITGNGTQPYPLEAVQEGLMGSYYIKNTNPNARVIDPTTATLEQVANTLAILINDIGQGRIDLTTPPVIQSANVENYATGLLAVSFDKYIIDYAQPDFGGFMVNDLVNQEAYEVTSVGGLDGYTGPSATIYLQLNPTTIINAATNGLAIQYNPAETYTIKSEVGQPAEYTVLYKGPWETIPPTMVSAEAYAPQSINITFSEPLNPDINSFYDDGGYTVTETGGSTTYEVTGGSYGYGYFTLQCADFSAATGGVTITYNAESPNAKTRDINNNLMLTDNIGVIAPVIF